MSFFVEASRRCCQDAPRVGRCPARRPGIRSSRAQRGVLACDRARMGSSAPHGRSRGSGRERRHAGRRGVRVRGSRSARLRPPRAFQFFDGKLEVHGYVGAADPRARQRLRRRRRVRSRAVVQRLRARDRGEAVPERGIGPLEIVEFYVRAEARYDCVWTRACGLFPSVNTYGNRAKHLPPRLIDGRQAGLGRRAADRRPPLLTQVDRDNYRARERATSAAQRSGAAALPGGARLRELVRQQLRPEPGLRADPPRPATIPPPSTSPASWTAASSARRNQRGGENGQVSRHPRSLEPELRRSRRTARCATSPNPFNALDMQPDPDGRRSPSEHRRRADRRLLNAAARPLDPDLRRPRRAAVSPGAVLTRTPSAASGATRRRASTCRAPALVREIESGKLDSIDQNFGAAGARVEPRREPAGREGAEGGLRRHRGSSRAGSGCASASRRSCGARRSSSATTDQFNPQDFAIASIPSLEESRIALWAARGTWSFYNSGRSRTCGSRSR